MVPRRPKIHQVCYGWWVGTKRDRLWLSAICKTCQQQTEFSQIAIADVQKLEKEDSLNPHIVSMELAVLASLPCFLERQELGYWAPFKEVWELEKGEHR